MYALGVQLERVDAAVHGVAERTLVVAAEVRLQVVPATAYCLAAQQAQEHAG